MRRLAVIVGLLAITSLPVAPTVAETTAEKVTWLGVQLGRQSGGETEGVPVVRVIRDSPAHKGGLRAKDLIVSVDGRPVADNGELIEAIQGQDVGSWIPLTVARGDDELDVRIRLATRPEGQRMRPRTGWIGVRAIALPAALREHFGAPKDSGVMISQIDAGSSAESAGFELGDVVFEVDGEPVPSPGEFYKMMGGAGVGNRVEFLLTRWGQELELEATVEDAPEGNSRR